MLQPTKEEMCKFFEAQVALYAPTHKINWLPASEWSDAYGINNTEGETDAPPLQLNIPKPENLGCLFVCMHELGHAYYKHTGDEDKDVHMEHHASLWARKQIEEHGWYVTARTWYMAEIFWKLHEAWREDLENNSETLFFWKILREKISPSGDKIISQKAFKALLTEPYDPTPAEPLKR